MEHLQDYIDELQDEIRWNNSFHRTQLKLVAAAQRAKEEIEDGKATAMDHDEL